MDNWAGAYTAFINYKTWITEQGRIQQYKLQDVDIWTGAYKDLLLWMKFGDRDSFELNCQERLK